jgi:hypothetical protein
MDTMLGFGWEHLLRSVRRGFLAVVDIDVKSDRQAPSQRSPPAAAAKALTHGDASLPRVSSGRGNGSAHLYCLTREPFKTFNPAQSADIVKVHMPSKKPSKREIAELSAKEIADGIRLSHAWEISLYSDGRQVVLPPSIHPDTGKNYSWGLALSSAEDLAVVDFVVPDVAGDTGSAGTSAESGDDGDFVSGESTREASPASERSGDATPLEFTVEPVELSWLPISDSIREGIIHGTGVTDRSSFLLPAATALHSAGLTQNEVLTVLTEPNTFLGACAYDHAKTKNRRRAVQWLYKYTVRKVFNERDVANIFKPVSEMEPEHELSGAELEKQNRFFSEERHWRQDIIRGGPKGDGAPKSIIQNVTLILTNAVGPEIFRRNVFAFRDAYGCATPWGGREGQAIEDDDVALIKLWLGKNYGFEPGKEVIFDAITNIACDNAFDPVRDRLDRLPAWDGKKRLDTWLVKHFQAEGDKEYLAQVFRKWVVAMILRVYQPGAKFDWMPIFEGHQGVGKSSFGRLLCGDKYFLDWLPNLNDKDAALGLQGMWVVEMGELSQFRKNELEVIKGFITRTIDKVRPPFGRKMIESPRRCVFFGTTNREKYLQDDTGNRRLKPVKVGSLDFEALARDRDQLFAEAKHLYDEKIETGKTLNLTGAAQIFEAKTHQEKMVEDDAYVMREQIEKFVEKQPEIAPDFNVEKFQISDLFGVMGPLVRWQHTNRNSQFAAKALKLLGGEKRHVKGRVYWIVPRGEGFSEDPVTLDFF